MAAMNARRCRSTRCQWLIVRDVGCGHISCVQCGHVFDWRAAEMVQASGLADEEVIESATDALLQVIERP